MEREDQGCKKGKELADSFLLSHQKIKSKGGISMAYQTREQLMSEIEQLEGVLETIFDEANSDDPDIDKILDLAADGLGIEEDQSESEED